MEERYGWLQILFSEINQDKLADSIASLFSIPRESVTVEGRLPDDWTNLDEKTLVVCQIEKLNGGDFPFNVDILFLKSYSSDMDMLEGISILCEKLECRALIDKSDDNNFSPLLYYEIRGRKDIRLVQVNLQLYDDNIFVIEKYIE